MAKVLVIGLDCAEPSLVFDSYIEHLPNMKKLLENSYYGRMRSCFPAITIPAWMVMATGKEPGEIGLYGFRQRSGNSYNDIDISHAGMVKQKKIWEMIPGKSVLVGVPPTYPPLNLNGCMVSCFLTPDSNSHFTHPKELKQELENVLGGEEYVFDVVFRDSNKDRILKEIYEMTERRFKVIKHLIKSKEWNLFWFVEIGVDRMHHAFWKFIDSTHHKYEAGSKYENAMLDYYIYLDKKIGELLELIDDDTYVLIISDHGAQPMKGAFAINQWLIDEGYLVLKSKPESAVKIGKADVDWSKTRAWGWGGYYSRVYINVKGREREGIIEQDDYESLRDELMAKLKELKGPNGERWENRIEKPERVYSETKGKPPDLMVYFDQMGWRAAGTLGYPSPYLGENDTGPDDAMHSEYGMYILYGKNIEKTQKDIEIYDVAPTLLKILGGNAKLKGRSIV